MHHIDALFHYVIDSRLRETSLAPCSRQMPATDQGAQQGRRKIGTSCAALRGAGVVANYVEGFSQAASLCIRGRQWIGLLLS